MTSYNTFRMQFLSMQNVQWISIHIISHIFSSSFLAIHCKVFIFCIVLLYNCVQLTETFLFSNFNLLNDPSSNLSKDHSSSLVNVAMLKTPITSRDKNNKFDFPQSQKKERPSAPPPPRVTSGV